VKPIGFTLAIAGYYSLCSSGCVDSLDQQTALTLPDEKYDALCTPSNCSFRITGFDAGLFSIDTGGFQNAFAGSWSVSQDGNDLFLNYAANQPTAGVPEPSTLMILGLGAIGMVSVQRRRGRGDVDSEQGEGRPSAG